MQIPTPLGPSPFHLTTPPMTLLKRLDSAPDPLLSLTSTLDLYFSYVIHTSTPLHNSISRYSDEVRDRTQFHWILLSSKVYFGHSWLYIWYTSAYIEFRRRITDNTPPQMTVEPSSSSDHTASSWCLSRAYSLISVMLISGAHTSIVCRSHLPEL